MVTELIQNSSFTRESFESFHSHELKDTAGWFRLLRENAMERFLEAGFPTLKEEDWKYTNVAPLAKTDFSPELDERAKKLDCVDCFYTEAAHSQLIFVNGIQRSDLTDLSALPDEVAVLDLQDAIADSRYGEMVRQHLGREADYIKNSFTALNTAFLSSGAFVYIPKGLHLKKPLHLAFVADPLPNNPATFPRLLLVADEGSKATVVESYFGHDGSYMTNAVVEVVLKENSRINHTKVQRESSKAFHIANTAAVLGRSSIYDSTAITLGAQLSRHDISVTMDAEGAECYVDGLYIVSTGQHADTHSVIDHRKPHCTSHQLYKGILDGKSRAVFNGKIFVRHDAQKTDAMQTNKNLLLSNEARVDTKPQLEILADDVKCAHGAAVGQIDEDELFYLETRGIHTNLARNLLTYGFAEEVINKIRLHSIKRQLDEAVLNRLNARLEAG
jgi:Fe-S cluster assembly protein SufD